LKYFDSLDFSIGRTPLFLCPEEIDNSGNNIYLKAEFLNPLGSVKDRAAKYIIEGAEKENKINLNSRIVEPTSGNTGISLAAICSVKKYKLSLVMPSSMSTERKKLLKYFGAELILTDPSSGMRGALDKAREMIEKNEADFMPDQFSNKYNLSAHYNTTGHEIYEDTEGCTDIFIAGVGTGGTISGAGKYLKEKKKNIKVIAVEPAESPVLSGGKPAPHQIQGIGAGFVPDLLDQDLIDEVIQVSGEKAMEYAKKTARFSGLLCGISSGAAVYAAKIISQRHEGKNINIVTVLPSTGERYISTGLFDLD